jgi:lincosamide and streptogramin A transport system ATP-binding/permease protein
MHLNLSAGNQANAGIMRVQEAFLKMVDLTLLLALLYHGGYGLMSVLGDYLSSKSGFITASHDRHFLDLCTDHIMSINKSDVRINKGNYTQWKTNMDIEAEFEFRKNENLRREVTSLESAAKNRRKWAGEKEKEKIGAYDKGFIGRRAAKQMKRALQIEKRINEKLEQKKSLLKNAEDERPLKIHGTKASNDKLLSLSNVLFRIQGRTIIENFSLDVHKGDRIAIIGDNGSGKTSLLKIMMKELTPDSGIVYRPNHITVSYSRQNPLWERGLLRDLIRKENIDETKFRNIMGVMGAWGELFERPLETFSKGQIKKIELCRSFMNPADLFIWDEPLNNLDIYSREQLEAVILKFEPTMIFTEHDLTFVANTATSVVTLT